MCAEVLGDGSLGGAAISAVWAEVAALAVVAHSLEWGRGRGLSEDTAPHV